MANTLSEALLILTSWNTASDNLISQPTRTLVKDFFETTLKSDEVSKLYCTVLDVEVSEDQKKDAENVGVTLIPATRSKWSDPVVDPPAPNWLLHHYTYYPGLKGLLHIKHVVSYSTTTKNAAAAIHESLFPQAQLYQLSIPTPPGVVFAFDAWSRDACGLTGYHRAIIQDFLVRKKTAGEHLKAYSTMVALDLSADQTKDAEKCGVTLIKAEQKKGVDEIPNINWLMYHYTHFPDLQKLQNIKYVVGYAPKTGWAAIEIRKNLFPNAKLVLINHVCVEENCLLVKDEFSDLEQEMLQMASHADLLFSIGPCIYDYFQCAYRAEICDRKLSDIPHKEILPKPRQQYFDNKSPGIENDAHTGSILTYGQLYTEEALKRCDSIAASIGSAADKHKDLGRKKLEWKIYGVSEQAYTSTKKFLVEKLQSSHAVLKPYKYNAANTLLQSLQQSDLYIPPSCYTDYSFEGLEAMAAGLPTTVQDDSHIAAMIERHFEHHKDYCVVRKKSEELNCKITKNLTQNKVAIQNAKQVKEDLAKSEAVTQSLAKFASSLTDEDAETQNSDKNGQTEMKEKRQEKFTALVTEPAMGIKEGSSNAETDAFMSFRRPVNNNEETLKTTGMESEIPDIEHVETTERTAMQSGISVTETAETRNVTQGISVTEDIGSWYTQATVAQPGISLTEGLETTTTTAMQHRISITGNKETAGTTEVHPGMPNTKDMDTTASTGTAVQSAIPVIQGEDTTIPTAMQHEVIEMEEETYNIVSITQGLFTGDENNDRNSKRLAIPRHKDHRKTKDKNNDIKRGHHEMSKKEDGMSRKRKPSEFEMSGQDESEAVKPKIQRILRVSKNPGTPQPSLQSIATGSDNDSAFVVHIGLNVELYEQQMGDRDKQEPASTVLEEKEKLKATWKECNGEFEKNTNEVITSEESQQIVCYNCKKYFGQVKVNSTKKSSLSIHLELPTVYNLYRLEHACLSGSFPDSFEQLLITDKMREEADKVGLQLKLKATYDQARFDELEMFFINTKFTVSNDVPHMSIVTTGLDHTPDVSECFVNSLGMTPKYQEMVVDLNQSKSMMMSLKERMLKRYTLMTNTLI